MFVLLHLHPHKRSLSDSVHGIRRSFNLIRDLTDLNSKQVRMRIFGAFSCLAIGKLLNVQVPFIFKGIVDNMNSVEMLSNSAHLPQVVLSGIIGYFSARIGASFFSEMRNVVFSKVSQNTIHNLTLSTFKHLHALDHAFHLSKDTGKVSKSIERGMKGLQFLYSTMVFNIAPTVFEILVVTVIFGTKFGSIFAVSTASTMALYAFVTTAVTNWRTKFRREMNMAENNAASKSFDSFINYDTVKLFQNEAFEANQYDKELIRYKKAALKTANSLAFLNVLQNGIFTVSLTGMMLLGCKGIQSGSLSIGDLVMINGLIFQLSLPLNFLGGVYREMKQATVDIEALLSLLKLQPSIRDIPNAPDLVLKAAKIKFENVSFSYENRQIFSGLSFEINGGEKVAFVGSSGCGKSTILKLLLRFYEHNSGRITIDDQDIRMVSLYSLRRAFGVIPQETSLFNRSIRYNLSYANTNASEDDIIVATQKAHIYTFIQTLPDGFESVVGERGLSLSGGEKQRISIARAILKNSPILAFDEATSALDANTEEEIIKTFKSVCKDKTALYIAHRLSSVADADKIFVIACGRIVESGRHEQLLAIPKGVYENMWKVQQKETCNKNE